MNFSFSSKLFKYNNLIAKKRRAGTFMDSLGKYNYKIGSEKHNKNPHAVELKYKNYLHKNKSLANERKLYWMHKNSSRPFGKFSKKSEFTFDYSKVPLYDIPNTDKFYLKNSISKSTPNIFPREHEDCNQINDGMFDKMRTDMLLSDNLEIRKLGLEIFETEFGKNQIKEFLNNDKSENLFFVSNKSLSIIQS